MALTKDDLKQIDGLLAKRLDDQRDKLVKFVKAENEILKNRIEAVESRLKITNLELRGVKHEVEILKEKIDSLIKAEDEDISTTYEDIEIIKNRLLRIERKVGISQI